MVTEESIVSLFFADVIPGIMLALSDAFIIVGVSLLIKLPRGKFEVRAVGRTFLEAWPALLMPVVVLGGLYGGVFTPTEAGAAAAGYALVYGLIAKRKAFLLELIPTTIRTMNLTAIVFFFWDVSVCFSCFSPIWDGRRTSQTGSIRSVYLQPVFFLC